MALLLVVAATLFGLSVFGLRGLLDIHDALRFAELDRLGAPAHWQLTRVWIGAVAAVPVFFAASALANGAWLAAAAVAGLGYAVAPRFLASARQRVEHDLLAWRGLGNSAIAAARDGLGTITMPHQNDHSARRLHQLCIPGLKEAGGVLPPLSIEDVRHFDESSSTHGFLYL